MILFTALVLSLLTGGRVDYLPDARRPWVVDFRHGRIGRGRTLYEAVRNYLGSEKHAAF
jgi:hypothetical protein